MPMQIPVLSAENIGEHQRMLGKKFYVTMDSHKIKFKTNFATS